MPADKRLGPGYPAQFQVQFRLVQQPELAKGQADPQIAHERQPFRPVGIGFGVINR